jgi:transcriptional regulator with XRE-family HTH domain
MINTIKYLEEAMRVLKAESQGQLAQRLGITRPAVSQYMAGTRVMDDYTAARVAKVLGIDPLKVIAAANGEREKDSEKRDFWIRLASEAGAPPMCIFLIFLPLIQRLAFVFSIPYAQFRQGRAGRWFRRQAHYFRSRLAWLSLRLRGPFNLMGFTHDHHNKKLGLLPTLARSRL